ncbi:unnamed protein product [Litomosoides sigmodontis]|uniref:lysoplasmalogenase n=1 Tax=Litomosoides sigmodontis TaxID=42156 RepID=A0A3P6TMR2_LITSI|nr:unnamed protein product [Litomosoides sigmodontis]
MSSLPLLNSTDVLIIYGTVCCLLYVETDGFRREAPFVNIMPTLSLTLLTFTLRVKKTIKLFTSLAFSIFAVAVYLHSLPRHNLQTACGLFTVAHISYILSFTSSIQRLWFECAVAVITYVGAFLYFCFVDLFWSIPVLALGVSFHFITLAISLIIAASIWYYGSERQNILADALLRFFGLLSFMICDSLLILNQFGDHIDGFNYISTALFYIGQPLLFVANQQAF